ncbi:MAG: hypothetical protein CMP23_01255 [Rickettsiales bacterium]|nr:hypothetical protein [Rickettsiales bacterium]|tara:strand:- start:2268 stop:2927 length:660 start_codon:yes stop_codon:yes gene_type:complete
MSALGQRNYSDPEAGLTLIELTLSISIIAVITVISYSVLHGSAAVAAEAEARADLDKMGRNAMRIMTRELSQAFISQNQTEYFKTVFKAEDRDPADEVYFVATAHEKRYANRKESNFAEYGYFSESDWNEGNFRTLVHRESTIVDDQPERGGRVLAMAHNMRSLNLRYYDKNKEEWLDEWDSESSDQMNRVPDAFEIRLELEDDGGRATSLFTRIRATP